MMHNTKKNEKDIFLEIQQAAQAFLILQILEEHHQTNDKILCSVLYEYGMTSSHRDLAILLDKLEAESLIGTKNIEQYRVVTATKSGNEVAQCRVKSDWISQDPTN